MFAVQKATFDDLIYIAENVDQRSAKAIEICGVDDIQEELVKLFRHSRHTLCASVDGTPIAIFGVLETSEGDGSAWLVATEGLMNVPVRLLVQARRFIKAFLLEFPRLRTIVWEENISHIRWVEWLGFKKQNTIPYGTNGELFHIFILET